jgi:uncharacterized membrane protein
MRNHQKRAIADAAALGAVAGMRSLLPLALLSFTVRRRRFPRLSSGSARIPLAVAAGAELVYDKLPFAQSRLEPPPLLARIGNGALVGGIAARSLRARPWVGAVVGGVAALASAFLSHRLRRLATERTKLPNAVGGVLEDVLAAGLSTGALRPIRA